MSSPHIIVGMSGGVDSSVAALLLKQQGCSVSGLFMKNWEEDDAETCSAAEDLHDAQQAAELIGIPLRTVNFATEYWDRVFEHFLAEYRAGRTPNPDVLCNREIKFRAFLDYALAQGATGIATGHYARIRHEGDTFHLLKAMDSDKDQSYFLHLLDQSQLSHAHFPLGTLTKPDVRRLAAESGLGNHAKKDSTGICFIGERRFRDFLQRFLPAQPGEIRTTEGVSVGRHEGLMYYTLGQRQGLGIGGLRDAGESPWYVTDKNIEHNVLVVAQGHDHPLLLKSTLTASQIHWISGTPPAMPLHCHARIRYRQPDQACTVEMSDTDTCRVRFAGPQRAVTPGQSAVFYIGDLCLGGGVIDAAQ